MFIYTNYSPAHDVSQKYLKGPQQAPGTGIRDPRSPMLCFLHLKMAPGLLSFYFFLFIFFPEEQNSRCFSLFYRHIQTQRDSCGNRSAELWAQACRQPPGIAADTSCQEAACKQQVKSLPGAAGRHALFLLPGKVSPWPAAGKELGRVAAPCVAHSRTSGAGNCQGTTAARATCEPRSSRCQQETTEKPRLRRKQKTLWF